MNEVKFKRVVRIDSPAFQQALKLYCESFPVEERHSNKVMKERVKNGQNHLYVAEIDAEIAFMALLWPLKNTGFVLLDYMATSPQHRGKNIGAAFLKQTSKRLRQIQQYLLIEVEDPDSGNSKEERQRRAAFYQRNGAAVLENFRYILPPLQGSTPTTMRLLALPAAAKKVLTTETLKKLIVQLYAELYNRHEDDSYLQAILQSINDDETTGC